MHLGACVFDLLHPANHRLKRSDDRFPYPSSPTYWVGTRETTTTGVSTVPAKVGHPLHLYIHPALMYRARST